MIHLVLELAFVGLIVWAAVTYIPMPSIVRTIILVVVAVCLILYLMGVFGIGDTPVPHLR